MAIQYVGGTTAVITASVSTTTNVSLTSLTGGIASAPSEGDMVVVVYSVCSTAARTLSATGYTSLATAYSNATYDANLYVGYKFMGSTPDTTVTVSATGATTDGGSVAIHVYRRAFLSVAAVTATGGGIISGIFANPPAITPTIPGSWVVFMGAGGGNALTASSLYSASYATNFQSAVSTAATNDAVVGLGYYPSWTSGSYDPASFTFGTSSSNNFSWAAASLVIAESSAATASDVNTGNAFVGEPTLNQNGPTIAFVGASDSPLTASSGTGNVSLTLPLNYLQNGAANCPSPGDVVLVFVASRATTNSSVISTMTTSATGYTQEAISDTGAAPNSRSQLSVLSKVMPNPTDTSVTVSVASNGNTGSYVAAAAFVVRNVASTIMDVTPTSASSGFSGAPNPPSITPITSGSLILAAGSSPPATLSSSDANVFETASISGGLAFGAGLYPRIFSGSFDPAAFTSSISNGWAAITIAVRTAIRIDTSVTLTGVPATGAVGQVAVATGVTNVYVTGVSSTGGVSTAAVTGVANTSVTGTTATGQVGTATAAIPASVTVTGLEATGSVGSVTTIAKASVTVTGIAVSGQVTAPSVAGAARMSLTGVQASGAVGVVATKINISVPVSGLTSTGSVGSVAASGTARVSLTGTSGTAAVGSVTVNTTLYVYPTGLASTGYVGAADVRGGSTASVNGLASAAYVASVDVAAGAYAEVSGLEAAAYSGSVDVRISMRVIAVGVQAYGLVSGVLVWGPIYPDGTYDYQNVVPVQVPVWDNIYGSSDTYTDVVPSQSPGYSNINPDQDPLWVSVST